MTLVEYCACKNFGEISGLKYRGGNAPAVFSLNSEALLLKKNVLYFTSSFLSNVGFKRDLVLLENQPVYF